jgi:hypothetical protein
MKHGSAADQLGGVSVGEFLNRSPMNIFDWPF